MLHGTVHSVAWHCAQCCTALCTMLHGTVHNVARHCAQYCTALCTVLHDSVHSVARHCAQCCTTLCTVLHDTVHNVARHCAQCCTALCTIWDIKPRNILYLRITINRPPYDCYVFRHLLATVQQYHLHCVAGVQCWWHHKQTNRQMYSNSHKTYIDVTTYSTVQYSTVQQT